MLLKPFFFALKSQMLAGVSLFIDQCNGAPQNILLHIYMLALGGRVITFIQWLKYMLNYYTTTV